MKATVKRRAHFNAAHRLYHRDWSDEQNYAIFGKCSYPNYHGHNYELVVAITGEIDEKTGFVIDLKIVKELIAAEIEEPFDHKNLNIDVTEFKNLNPTAENISVVIYNKLKKKLDPKFDLEITLYETRRNFVTYSGEL